jgi:hypothetical protein
MTKVNASLVPLNNHKSKLEVKGYNLSILTKSILVLFFPNWAKSLGKIVFLKGRQLNDIDTRLNSWTRHFSQTIKANGFS